MKIEFYLVLFLLLINVILALVTKNIHSAIGWGYGAGMFYFWNLLQKEGEKK